MILHRRSYTGTKTVACVQDGLFGDVVGPGRIHRNCTFQTWTDLLPQVEIPPAHCVCSDAF